MATLFLDLSGSNVRVLMTEGYRLVDTRILDVTVAGADDVTALLARIYSVTGQKIDHAHLILPDTDVTTDISKVQRMPLADAEKILSRQEPGQSGEASLKLTELAGPQHQLHCLTESVRYETIDRYREVFKEAGVKLDTMISPLQSILAAFAPTQQNIQRVEAIFNINNKSITALFLSSDEILDHAHIVLPPPEESSVETDDPIRALKRRQFAVLTPLHSIHSHFMLENPEMSVDKIWLCGAYEGIEGVAESLTEATELDVVLADHIADFDEGSCAFAALAGLLRVKDDPQRCNFMPRESLKTERMRPKVMLAAVSIMVLLCLAALVFITEGRIGRLKNDLRTAQTELTTIEASWSASKALAKNLSFLQSLRQAPTPFYAILKELAEQLPLSLELKELRYQHDPEKSSLDLVAVAAYDKLQGRSDIFTAMTDFLDRSQYLSRYEDPIIEIRSEGEEKLVQISMTCVLSANGGEGK